MTIPEPASFRPTFGRWLTGVIGVICGFAALISLGNPGPEAIVTTWPWLALLAGAAWAVFWQPEVRVDETSIVLVNVWHRVEVPWQLLIGIETKWTLTLVTAEQRYKAWAAPAPGRSVMRHEHRDTHRLKDAAIGGEIRPGDLPDTDSGAAANMVRKYWTSVRDSIAYDEPTSRSVTRSVHWRMIVVTAVLLAVAAIGLTEG